VPFPLLDSEEAVALGLLCTRGLARNIDPGAEVQVIACSELVETYRRR
jgi:hypothetical protein